MTDKLDVAEVLRMADAFVPDQGSSLWDCATLIRQMQAAMVEAEARSQVVGYSRHISEPLQPFLPKPDPLVEKIRSAAASNVAMTDAQVAAFADWVRPIAHPDGGTITWKDGV